MRQSSETPVPGESRGASPASDTFEESAIDPPSLAPRQDRVASSQTWIGRIMAGRFEIRRLLARGSMGRVYLAIQHPLGREVAVKVLEIQDSLDERGSYEERFLMEASVLAKLSHPNTVRVFDYGTWEGRLYLVMEYIEGETLRAMLRAEERLDAERVIRLGKQVAASLQEAHEQGVVHRDLKPGNILIRPRVGRPEQAKVVDFGLVKEVAPDSERTEAGLLMGTPRYMAPEQILEQHVDGRADIYALGAVLFRCITGEPPFAMRGAPALLNAHLTASVPRIEDVAPDLGLPPVVEWTLRTCLAKRPNDRFQDAGELISALDACLLALRQPDWFDVQLTLRDGRVESPFDIPDLTDSGHTLSVVLAAKPDEPRRRIGLPVLVALGVGLLGLVTGGVLLSGITTGPTAPVDAPSLRAVDADSAGAAEAPDPAPQPAPALGIVEPDEATELEGQPATEGEVEPEPVIHERQPDPKVVPRPTRRPVAEPEPGRGPAPADSGVGEAEPATGDAIDPPPTEAPSTEPARAPRDPSQASDLKNPFKK